MIVYGLDISTKTGIVALECIDGCVTTVAIEEELTSKETGLPRCSDLVGQMLEKFEKLPPDLVMVEELFFHVKNKKSIAIMAELNTIFRYFLWQMDVPFVTVPPTVLKKYVTGKGNSKKEEMLLYTYKNFGYEHPSNNVVDAYGLAHFGLHFLEGAHLTNTVKQLMTKVTFENRKLGD